MALAATAADVGWSSLLTTRFANTWAGDRLPAVPRQPEKTVLAWTTNEAASVFAARGRSAAVLVARRRGGGPVRANGIEVAEPAAASVTVTVMDDGRLGACGRILVAACGRCENEGMGFSADRRTVGREWGRGPVGIEPVTGSVEVEGLHWRGWVLASDGSRAAEVPLDAAGSNRMRLAMDPRHRTMWYWLER